MQSIEIDFEVFKELTARRVSERDTYNDVIRTLLKLPRHTPPLSELEIARAAAKGKVWQVGNVRFPADTAFRARYKGEVHRATVEGGKLKVKGRTFANPSSAATMITNTNVNGWDFWEAQLPGQSEWRKLSAFRNRTF